MLINNYIFMYLIRMNTYVFLKFYLAGRRPFRIEFHTNENEVIATSSQDATTSEDTTNPLGIIGFSLKYKQASC